MDVYPPKNAIFIGIDPYPYTRILDSGHEPLSDQLRLPIFWTTPAE